MRQVCRWASLGSLCLLLWAQTAFSSGSGTHISPESISLDLIVTGPDGKGIVDLEKNDLEVLLDGKKQKIVDFEWEGHSRTEDSAEAGQAAATESTFIVFLDLATTRPQALSRSRQAILDFVESQDHESLRLSLVTYRTGLTVSQPLSRNVQEFKSALAGIQTPAGAENSIGAFDHFSKRVNEAFQGASGWVDAASSAARSMEVFVRTVEQQVEGISAALRASSLRLQPESGHKHILFFSTGYPMQPSATARDMVDTRLTGGAPVSGATRQQLNAILSGVKSTRISPHIDSVVDEANRSGVRIHAIDPRGLIGVGENDAPRQQALSRAYSTLRRNATVHSPHEFLTQLAERTSGRLFLNRNDLSAGLAQVPVPAGSLYRASFVPAGKRKAGRFREIRVRSGRRATTIKHMRGYLDRDPAQVPSDNALLALNYPQLFEGDCRLQMERSAAQIQVKILIPTGDLRFRQEGDRFRGTIEVFAILVDASGQWVGKEMFFTKGQRLDFSGEQKANFSNFENATLTATVEAPPPGAYRVIGAVRHTADGSLSTVVQSLKVD